MTTALPQQQRIESPKLLLTSREAAKALSISERTLWGLANQGILRSIRIGRSVRYSLDELREFIAQQSRA